MALSTDDATRLAKLLGARDDLISGGGVAKVTINGKTTEFAKADMDRLDREIQALQAAAASPTGRTRGAVGFRL